MKIETPSWQQVKYSNIVLLVKQQNYQAWSYVSIQKPRSAYILQPRSGQLAGYTAACNYTYQNGHLPFHFSILH